MHYASVYFDPGIFTTFALFQAIDFHALMGYIGGYIGLFLGYALLQLPECIIFIKKHMLLLMHSQYKRNRRVEPSHGAENDQ